MQNPRELLLVLDYSDSPSLEVKTMHGAERVGVYDRITGGVLGGVHLKNKRLYVIACVCRYRP